MALELARHDVRVNALASGYIVTEFNHDFLALRCRRQHRRAAPDC